MHAAMNEGGDRASRADHASLEITIAAADCERDLQVERWQVRVRVEAGWVQVSIAEGHGLEFVRGLPTERTLAARQTWPPTSMPLLGLG